MKTLKKNITLRVNKELCEKFQKKFNMSFLFECILRNIDGQKYYIDFDKGKIYENEIN